MFSSTLARIRWWEKPEEQAQKLRLFLCWALPSSMESSTCVPEDKFDHIILYRIELDHPFPQDAWHWPSPLQEAPAVAKSICQARAMEANSWVLGENDLMIIFDGRSDGGQDKMKKISTKLLKKQKSFATQPRCPFRLLYSFQWRLGWADQAKVGHKGYLTDLAEMIFVASPKTATTPVRSRTYCNLPGENTSRGMSNCQTSTREARKKEERTMQGFQVSRGHAGYTVNLKVYDSVVCPSASLALLWPWTEQPTWP